MDTFRFMRNGSVQWEVTLISEFLHSEIRVISTLKPFCQAAKLTYSQDFILKNL